MTCCFMWVFNAIPSGLTAELRLTVKSLVWTCLHGRYGRCRGAGNPGGPHRRVAARRRERPRSGAAVRVASTPLADHRRRRRGRRCGHCVAALADVGLVVGWRPLHHHRHGAGDDGDHPADRDQLGHDASRRVRPTSTSPSPERSTVSTSRPDRRSRPGRSLATVDTTALNEQLSAAQAQLTSAQDRLASDEDASAAASQIDSDEASVTSAESSLSTAQTNLNDASLTSTISGTVASVDLTVGQQVSGSGGGSGDSGSAGTGSSDTGSTGPGRRRPPAARRRPGPTRPPARSWSSARTPTSSTPRSTTPRSVRSRTGTRSTSPWVGAAPRRPPCRLLGRGRARAGRLPRRDPGRPTIYGTVGSISLIGEPVLRCHDLPGRDRRDGNPSGLYAGASADVSIIVKQLSNVTEVPTDAISYTTGGQATVTKVVNGSHVVTNVTVGDAENGETQIVSGVQSGDKVLERQVTFKAPGGGAGGLFGGHRVARVASPAAVRSRRRRRIHRRWRLRRRRMITEPTGTPRSTRPVTPSLSSSG